MDERFSDWCRAVTDRVRFRPDRRAIARELRGHYEDRLAALTAAGMPEDAAKDRALRAMGDAEEIGRALDRCHKPGLGWCWQLSRAVLLVLACFVLMPFTARLWRDQAAEQFQYYFGSLAVPQDWEADGYCFYEDLQERLDWRVGEDAADRAEPGFRRLRTGQGTETALRAGDTVSVPYAALWEVRDVRRPAGWSAPEGGYCVSLVLRVQDENILDGSPRLRQAGICLALPDGTLLRLRTESGWLRDAQEADGPLCWADQESSARETRMYLYGWLDALPESAELRFPYGDPFTIPIQWKEVSE